VSRAIVFKDCMHVRHMVLLESNETFCDWIPPRMFWAKEYAYRRRRDVSGQKCSNLGRWRNGENLAHRL
jgi:hypothetical protein